MRAVVSRRHLAWVLAGALGLAGCADPARDPDPEAAPGGPRGPQITLRGAGATFPQPLYAKWGLAYFERTRVKVAYQGVGSEAGLRAITDGTVDFGASDIPLPASELERRGLVQFPMAIGAIVPVANLPGLQPEQLVLSGDVIARIYTGKITRWNDAALRALNPELPLPDQDIIPVYRADASGTTWLLSTLLSQVSPDWKASMGAGAILSWPVGVGAQGNAQLARFVRRFSYTLGYVQLAEARIEGLSWARLRNRYGQLVSPDDTAVEIAALRYISMAAERLPLAPPEQPDPRIWPLTTSTYILLRREPRNAARARQVLEFLWWGLTVGAETTRALSYLPVPAHLVQAIDALWAAQLRVEDEPVWSSHAVPPPPDRAAGARAVDAGAEDGARREAPRGPGER